MLELPADVVTAINVVIAACQHLASAAIEHARDAVSNAEQVINYFHQS